MSDCKNKKLIEQIMIVRETSLANMFYCGEVREVAEKLGLDLLSNYLKESQDNRLKYFYFIRSGGTTEL